MWKPIARRFVAKEYRFNHPHMGCYLNEMENCRTWDAEQTAQARWQRLSELLDHAYQTAPFYRARFDEAGISPADMRSVDDLAYFPILTKDDLRRNEKELLSTAFPPDRRWRNQSGGSTGMPVTFWQCREYLDRSGAARHFADRMAGYSPGRRYLVLWGADVDSKHFTGPRAWVRCRLRNIRFVNTFAMSPRVLRRCLRLIERWQPQFVLGYATSVVLVSQAMREQRKHPMPPSGIITSAEVLTRDDRVAIRTAWGAPVFDRYGCREASLIAQQCRERGGLHCFEPNNYVEIVDDEGRPLPPGEIGRVVVTNLHNHAMPLIRYDLGDLGSFARGECECGLAWRRLERIDGRRGSLVVSPSGKLLHGEFFTHLFYGAEGVRRFRVIQRDRAHLEIAIVADEGWTEDSEKRLLGALHERGDPAFEVKFERVPALEPSASGKYEFVRSEVSWSPGSPGSPGDQTAQEDGCA